MSLTVKAYLKRGENANKEIRRFSVDQGVAANYEYLSRTIAQMFPSVGNPDNFTLAYKDAENDLITFSTDEELVEGLGQMTEDVFRVHVQVLPRRRGEANTNSGSCAFEEDVYHPGVVCDGCEAPIRGPRFKCIECPDYDLCKVCEEKGLHEQHQFVKFRRPQIGRSRCGGFYPGMWRAFGHPGWRHWWWAQQQQQQQQPQQQPQQPQQQQQQQQPQGCGPDTPQATCNPEGRGQSGDKPGEGQGQFNPASFLHDIGQSVAQMLDPLGIDVDIDVEHDGQRRKCNGGGRGGRFRSWGYGHGHKHGKNKGCKGKWRYYGSSEEEKQQQQQETGEGMQSDAGAAAAARADPAANKAGGDTEKSGNKTGAKENETMETDSTTGGGQNEPGWTLLDESGSSQSGPGPSAPPATGSGDATDQAVQSEAEKLQDMHISPHPDERIANALSYMKAMGYTDDGGWLTRLLEAKAGDINRALDAIKFGAQQQQPPPLPK